jgi:flagellar basal body-associated protein FliL
MVMMIMIVVVVVMMMMPMMHIVMLLCDNGDGHDHQIHDTDHLRQGPQPTKVLARCGRCHFWFNTAFIERNFLVLEKSVVDKVRLSFIQRGPPPLV